MRRALLFFSLLTLTTLGIAPVNSWVEFAAQADCGTATTVDFPIDTTAFKLVQAFGVPSPRHQGRYHTGEDWHLGRGQSFGQPVHAIADGRVTYSYPLGWGRDGGVVIIEHSFGDGTVVYSQYGHMFESDTIKFPARLSCVKHGDMIGTIGDVRPAPHIHFEIRVNSPDTPGPGYSWDDPYIGGWRNPSQFVLSQQAALHPAYRWHLTTLSARGFASAPLTLSDNSLMYLDGAQLRLATYDGRVLWRVRQDSAPLAMLHDDTIEGFPLVLYPDGRVQQVDFDGTAITTWRLNIAPTAPPLFNGTHWLIQDADGQVAQISANMRGVDWTLEGVPRLKTAQVAGDVIGLLTEGQTLIIVSNGEAGSQIIDRARLRDDASMAVSPDGTLLVYGRGGLWRVDSAGTWTLAHESGRAINGDSAILPNSEGGLIAYDGAALHAYDLTSGGAAWSLNLGIDGRITLDQHDDTLLLVSNHGQVAVVDSSGRLCSALRLYGDDRAATWHHFGDDGLLRVAIGDQVTGLDWAELTRPCTV